LYIYVQTAILASDTAVAANLYAVLIADVVASSAQRSLRARLGATLASASHSHVRRKWIALPYSITAGDEFQTVTANFRALPQPTQLRVLAQAEARGVKSTGEALFLHAYPIVTASSVLQARLDDFRNQYGFARNMSFAFLTAAAAILVAHHLGYHPVRYRWALLSGLAGITLFYRYLKFHRLYAVEVFLGYLNSDPPAGEKSRK